MEERKTLVDIKSHIKNPILRFLYGLVSFPLESFLGFRKLNRAYYFVQDHPEYGNFFNRGICAMGISYEVDEDDLKKIPKTGPLMVVSNHPLGGLDGIILGAMLLSVREDAKLVVNSLLAHMDLIKPWVVEVNPFGGPKATAQNVGAMKQILRTMKDGGCIATFPSGTVSHIIFPDRIITDPEWNENLVQIARRTKANILPIYIEGRNSALFYLAGLINPKLRTLLLVREMFLQAKKRPVKFKVGSVITPKDAAQFASDSELTSWLRLKTYLLAKRTKQEVPASFGQIKNIQKNILSIIPGMEKKMSELILPVDSSLMEREIAALPESSIMVNGEKIRVYCAEAWQIRWTLIEIGRLREKTFREVGEGTGKSVDNDAFDQYYLHMFLWDVENKRIAGAYRIGRTDKIISSMGIQGLYTSTLFNIKPELMQRISPALEMGRSFIVNEYQKKRSTLAILWRGIGVFMHTHPQYKTLYGPVSISTEYTSISKDLIVQFLTERKTAHDLAKFVKAKKPPKIKLKDSDKRVLSMAAADIDKVSALVSEVEIDNKGIPTLLKHYLKLDGELLAFNMDASFGSCIDGLIMVDLTKTDPKLLKSYMGEEQAIEYRKYHGLADCSSNKKKD